MVMGVLGAAESKETDFPAKKYRWTLEDRSRVPSLAFCEHGKVAIFVYNLDGSYGTPLDHTVLYQGSADRWPYPLGGPLALTRMIRTELGDEVPARFLKQNLPGILRDTQSETILGAAILNPDLFEKMWSAELAPEAFGGEKKLLMDCVHDVELDETGNRWILNFIVQCRGSQGGIALARVTANGLRRPFSIVTIKSTIVIDDRYWENRVEAKLRETLSGSTK